MNGVKWIICLFFVIFILGVVEAAIGMGIFTQIKFRNERVPAIYKIKKEEDNKYSVINQNGEIVVYLQGDIYNDLQ